MVVGELIRHLRVGDWTQVHHEGPLSSTMYVVDRVTWPVVEEDSGERQNHPKGAATLVAYDVEARWRGYLTPGTAPMAAQGGHPGHLGIGVDAVRSGG